MSDETQPGDALYARALRLLTVRMRSESELRARLISGTKATGPGDPVLVEETIEKLKTRRLLDDRRFAREFARSRFEHRLRGLLLTISELTKRGIAEETATAAAEEALAEAGGADEVLERALEKRLRTRGAPRNRKGLASLVRYLTGKGHLSSDVFRHFEKRFPDLFTD